MTMIKKEEFSLLNMILIRIITIFVSCCLYCLINVLVIYGTFLIYESQGKDNSSGINMIVNPTEA